MASTESFGEAFTNSSIRLYGHGRVILGSLKLTYRGTPKFGFADLHIKMVIGCFVSCLDEVPGLAFAWMSSKAFGDDSILSPLHQTPWLEEEEHRNAFAICADGLFSTAKLHSNVRNVPFTKALWSPRTTLWAPLSCSCFAHNYRMGNPKWVMHSLAEGMRPGSSVIQSSMYASSSRFEDKAKIRALMEARGLKKEPGWSRIEIQGQLNTFLVDDKSHPRNKEIREELQRMLEVMKDAGYVADLRCVLRDIPESEKEQALQHHSERLAMALGHISLPPRAPMRIIKNLRVCNDCHVATKYFAYIYRREIIVRDATRFHHFREGYCSCGDYW